MSSLIRKLLRYFYVGATRSESSASAYRRPMGYQQLVLSGTAQFLTVPGASGGYVVGYAIIQCVGTTSTASWRDDGVAPTAGAGMTLAAGQELDYSGDLTQIQFINATSSNTLNISYYA